ncbi:MAG TPA: GreA/GreB family elongation factor [Opitutus sp.]|nr:GreA/GreB family elongation factor [Opitutus sp.]
MSKAFLRESDLGTVPEPAPLAQVLPAGARNYLTQAGAERLREELTQFVQQERPRLTGSDDPEIRRQLKVLDQRIRYLQQSLATAEIVSPPEHNDGVVRFGASVTVEAEDGEVTKYRIVGVDEADFEDSAVSWTSPIARALLNHRRGDIVRFKAPAGERRLEILHVEY